MIAAKTTVPITLNRKWISATRFALGVPPTEASNAVTHVPMFAPKTINSANSRPKTPVPTIVMTTPVAADELWIRAVNTAPTKIKRSGKLMTLKILVNSSFTRALPKASGLLIIFRPTKIRPRPLQRLPAICTFSFFTKPIITPAKARKYMTILKKSFFSATSTLVTVVPILAPIMMGVACISVITPALTRPIAITEVADEL